MSACIRRMVTTVEDISAPRSLQRPGALRKVTAAAVIENPFAGRYADDLDTLYEIGAELGELLVRRAVTALGRPAEQVHSYGKAALVGLAGEEEHGAAVLHPQFGKAVRAFLPHAQTIMPSTLKRASAGASIDVPLHSVRDEWSVDHMDTATLALHDGPAPDEIMVVLALADGGRLHARTRSPRAS